MSRSSKPNWNADKAGPNLWFVYDGDGSGRAYRVQFAWRGGPTRRVPTRVTNTTAGRRMRELDVNGPTARELVAAIRKQHPEAVR